VKSGRLRAGAVRAPPDAHVRVEDEAWARTLNAAAAICLKSRRGHVLLRARVDHASPMRQLALHLPHHKPIQLLAADAQVLLREDDRRADAAEHLVNLHRASLSGVARSVTIKGRLLAPRA